MKKLKVGWSIRARKYEEKIKEMYCEMQFVTLRCVLSFSV